MSQFSYSLPAEGLSSLQESRELKTGFLLKQGGSFKSWKRRYFVLYRNDADLYYFKTPKDTAPLGQISLRGAALAYADAEVHKSYPFKISNPYQHDSRIYFMSCSSDSERESWMKMLQSVSVAGVALLRAPASNSPAQKTTRSASQPVNQIDPNFTGVRAIAQPLSPSAASPSASQGSMSSVPSSVTSLASFNAPSNPWAPGAGGSGLGGNAGDASAKGLQRSQSTPPQQQPLDDGGLDPILLEKFPMDILVKMKEKLDEDEKVEIEHVTGKFRHLKHSIVEVLHDKLAGGLR
eukprot:Opistho-2@85430